MACYLYCITKGEVNNGFKKCFDVKGLDEEEVYPINCKNIIAVVHDCQPVPYKGDDKLVKEWVVQHNRVVEHIYKYFNLVIPFTFDMIIKGDNKNKARENLKIWVKKNRDAIKKQFDILAGKSEYHIKIIINKNMYCNFNKKDINANTSFNDGTAYLKYKQARREARKVLKQSLLDFKKECINNIEKFVDNLVENKCSSLKKKEQMLLNLSVLTGKGGENELGLYLGEINQKKGITVHYTGPWPCYSFVEMF